MAAGFSADLVGKVDFAATFGGPGVLGSVVGVHGDNAVRNPDHQGDGGGNGGDDALIEGIRGRMSRGAPVSWERVGGRVARGCAPSG